MFDINELGPAVRAILNNPEKWDGQAIPLRGSSLTLADVAKTFSSATGIPAEAVNVPSGEMAKQGKEMAEMAEMFDWFNDYGYYGNPTTEGLELGQTLLGRPFASLGDWIRQTGGWNEMAKDQTKAQAKDQTKAQAN